MLFYSRLLAIVDLPQSHDSRHPVSWSISQLLNEVFDLKGVLTRSFARPEWRPALIYDLEEWGLQAASQYFAFSHSRVLFSVNKTPIYSIANECQILACVSKVSEHFLAFDVCRMICCINFANGLNSVAVKVKCSLARWFECKKSWVVSSGTPRWRRVVGIVLSYASYKMV